MSIDAPRAIDSFQVRLSAGSIDRAQEKIGPIVAELGLPMPRISEFEVHAVLAPAENITLSSAV